jgi:hypothetical protein
MSLALRQFRPATRADLDALPADPAPRVIDDEISAFPRPGAPHAHPIA